VRAFSDDEMIYIFAVPDMRVYLNKRYIEEENYNGSKEAMVRKIKDRQGILAFGYFHIDLWLGSNIQRPDDYWLDEVWGIQYRFAGCFR
jgi:hypothetical protein